MTSENNPLIPVRVEPEPIPSVHEDTLGRRAVIFAEDTAVFAINAGQIAVALDRSEAVTLRTLGPDADHVNTYLALGSDELSPEEAGLIRYAILNKAIGLHMAKAAGRSEEKVGAEVREVRKHLRGLDDKGKNLLEQYCISSAPAGLRAIKSNATGDSGIPWVKWLSKKANRAQLLNFLQWHVSVIEQEQLDPEVQKLIAAQRTEYKQNLAAGLAAGWLHPDTQAAIDAVDDVPVFIGDIFDTSIKDKSGVHRAGQVIIAGSSDLRKPKSATVFRNIRHAVKHEWNHAVFGGFNLRWLNEALTEHIRQVFEEGQLEVMDPRERTSVQTMYQAERALLATVLNGGTDSITVMSATQAYSEKKNNGKTKQQFINSINTGWSRRILGNDAKPLPFLDRLSAHIKQIEDTYIQDGMRRMPAQAKAVKEAHETLLLQPEVFFEQELASSSAELLTVQA